MSQKLSAATMRAANYPKKDNQWFCGFEYTQIEGLGYEEGVHRRDPSSIIKVNGLYYVWYTKSTGVYFGRSHNSGNHFKQFPWDYADIYYATSPDGIHWTERGCAIHRGKPGDYDDRTVCTPDVLAHDGKYYLVYQCASNPYSGLNEKVAMAIADSPDGPWTKLDSPILAPREEGEWFGNSDSYNYGKFVGLTHDPSLFYYKGKYYLYYKCGAYTTGGFDSGLKYAGPDTRWGVAISDRPEGEYVPSEYNPITNSGHETLLWHYKGGIAALINRDGPEKDTIQYAKDGINFEIMSHVSNTPQAGGVYRTPNHDEHPLAGLSWGLCHVDERGSLWNYILRFDVDPRHPYSHPLYYPAPNSVSIR